VTYENAARLLQDLTASGARNSLRGRSRALTGGRRFRAMLEGLESARRDGLLRLELELVYGHCWGAGPRPRAGEAHVDAAAIGRRRP
jgi:malonyl-CoA O-methyltransferase